MRSPEFDGFVIGVALTLAVVCFALAFASSNNMLTAIQAAGPVAIALSAYIGYRVYVSNVEVQNLERSRRVSEAYLRESILLLERALETFTRNGENPPENDRLIWLSTARMIKRFDDMKCRVTEDEHLKILDENEEYIRLKFYTIIDSNRSNFDREYFMPEGTLHRGNVIDRKSIAVIFTFMRWPKGMQDPLEVVDDKYLFARGAVPIDYFGVEEFLKQYEPYWSDIQGLKAEHDRQT